jgi:hypothetical protein
MTVTLERSPLADALEIPGARAVALLDAADGATVLWWAGVSSPGEQEAALAVALAVAAAGLVVLTDPADELGDVLVTSAAAFHVLRLTGDGTQVAHLMLRRAGANLAMARQEFRALAEAHARQPRHAAAAASAPVSPVTPAPASSAPASPEPASSAVPPPGAALPRRRPNGAPVAVNKPPSADEAGATVPGWLTMLGQPYLTDESVLDRILVTLRHL